MTTPQKWYWLIIALGTAIPAVGLVSFIIYDWVTIRHVEPWNYQTLSTYALNALLFLTIYVGLSAMPFIILALFARWKLRTAHEAQRGAWYNTRVKLKIGGAVAGLFCLYFWFWAGAGISPWTIKSGDEYDWPGMGQGMAVAMFVLPLVGLLLGVIGYWSGWILSKLLDKSHNSKLD